MDIILGSSSKTRYQAMQTLGLPFRAIASDFDEETTKADHIEDLVIATARGKAAVLQNLYPTSLIITADSCHLFESKKYGKPSSLAQAREWLLAMRGKTQETYVALVLTLGAQQTVDLVVSSYTFKNFSPAELEAYVTQVNPLEKATGYTPAGPGLALLENFTGEPGSELALPLHTLTKRLREFGVSL